MTTRSAGSEGAEAPDWEPTEDDLARIVAVTGHMALFVAPPGTETEVGTRLIHALKRLGIRLVDAAPPSAPNPEPNMDWLEGYEEGVKRGRATAAPDPEGLPSVDLPLAEDMERLARRLGDDFVAGNVDAAGVASILYHAAREYRRGRLSPVEPTDKGNDQ